MTTIATNKEALANFLRGKGAIVPMDFGSSATTTAAVAGSGSISVQLVRPNLGTLATPIGWPAPPMSAKQLLSTFFGQSAGATQAAWLVRLYTLGTVSLTTTGDKFTHDAGFTGPLRRKQLGQANQAIPLIPLLIVTTALTGTAAVLRLRTAAVAAGYTNQSGTAVIGTRDFTFPSATTAIESGFFLPLEIGDSGVRDINAINVTLAATAGAATIYGVEPILPVAFTTLMGGCNDGLFGGLQIPELTPATPVSGTVPTSLMMLVLNQTSNPGNRVGVHLSVVNE